MFFEIHDIILRRLWKGTKKAKTSYTLFLMGDVFSFRPIFQMLYYYISSFERLTRRWYMNHVHKECYSYAPTN